MKSPIELFHPSGRPEYAISLPSSKSESNRALIIQALSGNRVEVDNLSDARDTQTLIRLLGSRDRVADVIDAGTTFRFLTAFFCATNQGKVLTGTERMKERPVRILAEALKELGFAIQYLESPGYPPLEISPVDSSRIGRRVRIKGDVSSQYISALLMIAPVLPDGLSIELTGSIASRPYLEMTLKMMADCGILYSWEGNVISIDRQEYRKMQFYVESDWSAASYWYSIIALSRGGHAELKGLKKDSLQGDSAVVKLMEAMGVSTEFGANGVTIRQAKDVRDIDLGTIDFEKIPDLAQTVAVLCAAKNIRIRLTGLRSLRIKETDRIAAMQQELNKVNVILVQEQEDLFALSGIYKAPSSAISTYQDHRMAMAFAPLGMLSAVKIEDPGVVVKSYPGFWDDLQKAGFVVK